MRPSWTEILDISGKSVHLQCVFHSIRFKVNKKIGCLGEIAFFFMKTILVFSCNHCSLASSCGMRMDV